MRILHVTSLLAMLLAMMVASCGGGGSGYPASQEGAIAPAVATYRDTTLPGRLLVNSPTGEAAIFDLRTGERSTLPASDTTADGDHWTISADGNVLVRWNEAVWRKQIPISFFDGRLITKAREDTLVPRDIMTPVLSPDGRNVLTFWTPGSEDTRLAVFDAVTSELVKRGSLLDGEIVNANAAAWLPSGSYIYMVGPKLYLSSLASGSSQLIAKLNLPINNEVDGGNYVAGQSHISVSQDGRRLAFTWHERRSNFVFDTNIWVVNIDGTGLRRLTSAPDPTSPVHFDYGSPRWSPDGQWVAGVLFMNDSAVAPIYPDAPFAGGHVVGTTGCALSPVFVVPANDENVAVSWPRYDSNYGVKVVAATGKGGEWVSTCSSIHWLP